jgi:hypothetical protein
LLTLNIGCTGLRRWWLLCLPLVKEEEELEYIKNSTVGERVDPFPGTIYLEDLM